MIEVRLKSGAPAPPFAAETSMGETLRLSTYLRRKVWLSFFRYASCPFCNLRIHEMRDRQATFSQLQIIAVFHSPRERLTPTSAIGGKVWFPLVCDPQMQLYRQYGVAGGAIVPSIKMLGQAAKAMSKGYLPGAADGPMAQRPADFFIDERGVLREAFYRRDIADNIAFDRVDAFAATPAV